MLDAAEKQMKALKDEFLSAEHYLLALTDAMSPAARLLQGRRRHPRASSCRRSSRCAASSA